MTVSSVVRARSPTNGSSQPIVFRSFERGGCSRTCVHARAYAVASLTSWERTPRQVLESSFDAGTYTQSNACKTSAHSSKT